MRIPTSKFLPTIVLGAVVVVLSACGGGGGDGGTGPGPGGGTPAFAIAASANALTVARGASGTVTVTVTRSGGFTGPVSLQPTGMPTGVTALFSDPSVPSGSTTSTLTIAAGATAAAGTATITVIGNGAGAANQSLTIQLTVTAPVTTGPFALSLSVTSFLALPPTNLFAMPVLTITRNAGFTGAVAISATGLPAGLVVASSPSSVTGNTANITIINGGAANGTYPVTLRGVGGGGEQSITFNIVVASPSTGSTTWTLCTSGTRSPQYFFAVKDGAGAWTRVVPNGMSYSFTVASAQAQVAMVVPEGFGYRTTIYQYTAQEIAARAAAECVLYQPSSTRQVGGQVTGLGNAELSMTNMGYWHASTLSNGVYSMLNLPAGALDLVSVRGTTSATGDFLMNRGVIRRGLNPAAGASNAPIDFAAAESFAPANVNWTFGNTNNQVFGVSVFFETAGGTSSQLMVVPGLDNNTTVRTLGTIPTAQTVAGDRHVVIATIQTNGAATTARATRQLVTYGRSLANRTINFGPDMSAATVSAVAGAPTGRLRAQGTLPTEYNSGVTLDVSQAGIDKYATIHATRAFLGAGTAYDIQIPDMSAATGWDTNFALRAGTAGTYWVSGGGATYDIFDVRYIFSSTAVRWAGTQTGITTPTEGATFLTGRVAGTITP